MNLIEMKSEQAEIDDPKSNAKALIQKNQIKELRDTHGSQLERLSRNKEKLKALQIELTERVKYHKRLLDRYSDENLNNSKLDDGLEFKNRVEFLGKEDDKKDELHSKIMDKLTMNLDKLTSHIEKKLKDEFQLKEKNASNDDGKEAYSKPYFLAICVKYMEKFYKPMNFLENNKEEKYDELVEKISFETFRISRTTTFKDLKNQAGDFWKLPTTTATQIQEYKDKEDLIPMKWKSITEKKYNQYELLDENYNEINENLTPIIENYFQQKGTEFNQALVILRLKETKIHVMDIDLRRGNKDKKEILPFKQRNDEDFMYNEFYRRFPGMKKYIPIKISKVRKKKTDGEGYLFNDNHFCVFFWIFIMLILNLLSVLLTINVSKIYINNENILSLLSAKPNFKAKEPTEESNFYSIANSDGYYKYLEDNIGKQIFYDANESLSSETRIYKSYIIVGQIMLRQVKILERDCIMYSKPGNICTYPYYTQDLRDETVKDSFETEQTTKITETITGEFGIYDGSGYVQKISPYKTSGNFSAYIFFRSIIKDNFRRENFMQIVKKLQENSYIDLLTQALILQFNLYNPNQDLWTSVNLLVEVCPTGTFFSFPALSNNFKLDIYSSNNGAVIKAADVLKGIIAVFLLIFILYFVFCSRQMGEFNFAYITSFQGISNFLIVIFTYVTIYYSSSQAGLTYNEKEIFSYENYIDLASYSLFYNYYYIYESILVAILILRCFSVLKINKRFNILIKTIENAQTDIFNYSIILFPILLGFSLLAQSIYGNSLVDYSTFGRSFISVLLLTIGDVNWRKMNTAAPVITLPFLLIFYLIIVFFLLSLFLGIYIDNYRTVVLEIGFLYEKEPSWKPKDYVKWVLHWMPKKCLKHLKLINLDENIKKYD